MSKLEENEQTYEFVCECCEYSTNKKVNFERHKDSAKHFKCVEKYNKNKEKQVKIQEKEEKQIKLSALQLIKEQEKIRKSAAKEQLDLLKYQLLLKEAERKKLKQDKADAKLAKAEAKAEQKEHEKEQAKEQIKQEAIAFDYIMMNINDIDDNINFNWKKELEQNDFYPNLLMALASNPKTYNVRMVNDNVELWQKCSDLPNGKWITEDEYDDIPEKFTFKDIELYCQGITYNTKQLRNYKYQLDRHNGLLLHNPLYRSQCRQALGGFGDELRQKRKQREEQNNERVLSQREHIPTVDEVRKTKKITVSPDNESETSEDNEVLGDIEFE